MKRSIPNSVQLAMDGSDLSFLSLALPPSTRGNLVSIAG